MAGRAIERERQSAMSVFGRKSAVQKSRRATVDSAGFMAGPDISILDSINIALTEILEYTIYCTLVLIMGANMEEANNKQIVKYSAISPSVLFHRMRTDLAGRWDQNKMVDAVRRWLRPPVKRKIASALPEQRRSTSNIIIPDAHDPFMLLAKSDPMSNLLAENHRLRNLIDEILTDDRRFRSLEYRS